MQRLVLLMAVLQTIAPQTTTVPDNERTTMGPPTVFRRVTPKPRKPYKGKSDSPMLNYIFDSYATSNKHFHDMFRPPAFEGDLTTEDTILDADTGANVVFDCKVTALRDKTVSWLRVSDDENLELLTVDLDTHTADARYRVDLAGENWKLALTDAKVLDSGVYCCHVSTHPPMLRRFQLTVHPPTIKMSNEAFLETGETLSLKCSVLNLYPGEEEPVMHWYRGNTTTSLDEVRGGVLIETDHLTLTSHLQVLGKPYPSHNVPGTIAHHIKLLLTLHKVSENTSRSDGGFTTTLTLSSGSVARLKMEDAGNYTCSLELPIRMRAVARVHVLQGSSLAELQSGVKTTSSYLSLLLSSLLLVFGSWFGDVR